MREQTLVREPGPAPSQLSVASQIILVFSLIMTEEIYKVPHGSLCHPNIRHSSSSWLPIAEPPTTCDSRRRKSLVLSGMQWAWMRVE